MSADLDRLLSFSLAPPMTKSGLVCERCRRPSPTIYAAPVREDWEAGQVGPRYVPTMRRVMTVCGRCAT